MSQINLHEIIRQQQEQLAAMQAQIQALLAAQGGVGERGGAVGSSLGSHIEMAKPAIFNGEAGKVGGFVTACRSYLKMKMREGTLEEQIIWVLSYVQGGSADVWKENCYDSKLKVLSNETTLVLSNTRELDRVPSTE